MVEAEAWRAREKLTRPEGAKNPIFPEENVIFLLADDG